MPGKDVLYMELNEKNVEPMCPIIDIDGYIANGKQYDLDITLANDNHCFLVHFQNLYDSRNLV